MKTARTSLGLGQAEFAEKFGVNVRTYRKNEGGQNEPGISLMDAFARAGINAHWLLTGEGEMLLKDISVAADIPSEVHSVPLTHNSYATPDSDVQTLVHEDPAGYAAIPLYDVHAAAGSGAIVDSEHVVDFLHFKQDWIRHELHAKPADLYLIYVDGESMEPTLRPGDVILVDRRDHLQARDGIYVLRMDGTLLVKRLQRLPGGIIKVSSDNASYQPFDLKASDLENADFAIVGRVVWTGRRM